MARNALSHVLQQPLAVSVTATCRPPPAITAARLDAQPMLDDVLLLRRRKWPELDQVEEGLEALQVDAVGSRGDDHRVPLRRKHLHDVVLDLRELRAAFVESVDEQQSPSAAHRLPQRTIELGAHPVLELQCEVHPIHVFTRREQGSMALKQQLPLVHLDQDGDDVGRFL